MKRKSIWLVCLLGLALSAALAFGQAPDQPSEWARETWQWATAQGLTDGTNPQGACTREMVMTWLYRLEQKRAQDSLSLDIPDYPVASPPPATPSYPGLVMSELRWHRETVGKGTKMESQVITVKARLTNTGSTPLDLKGPQRFGAPWLLLLDAYDKARRLVSTTQPSTVVIGYVGGGKITPNPIPPGSYAALEARIKDDPSITDLKLRFIF